MAYLENICVFNLNLGCIVSIIIVTGQYSHEKERDGSHENVV
jgi:hypothetical protein